MLKTVQKEIKNDKGQVKNMTRKESCKRQNMENQKYHR